MADNIHPDVIVVGGGPAGSTCARDLVRAGANVLVIDRARFPRDKCCAGWITPAVVTTLDLDVDDYARGRTLQTVTGFATSVFGRRAVTNDFGRAVSYAIRRCEFDSFLLQRSGARLETGTPVKRIERRDARWIVNDRFEAPMLVGAGGHFCPVARTLNPGHDDGPVVVAREVEFRMASDAARRCPVDGEVPELFFCDDRRGYGWCVRKGEYLNVGFGRLGDGGEFNAHLARAVQQMEAAGRVPPDLPNRWTGHAYRIYAYPARQIVHDGVLLAGDAAGLAHPVSGEGILRAVESGRLAAQGIIAARGEYSAARLQHYANAVRARYGKPNAVALGEPTWSSRAASRLGTWLMSTHWFTRRVLLERWFLHTGVPALQDRSIGPDLRIPGWRSVASS